MHHVEQRFVFPLLQENNMFLILLSVRKFYLWNKWRACGQS